MFGSYCNYNEKRLKLSPLYKNSRRILLRIYRLLIFEFNHIYLFKFINSDKAYENILRIYQDICNQLICKKHLLVIVFPHD